MGMRMRQRQREWWLWWRKRIRNFENLLIDGDEVMSGSPRPKGSRVLGRTSWIRLAGT